MLAWLLAHQGGWDEILMVVGPLALLWLLLRMAKRRADRMAPAPDATPDASSNPDPLSPGASPKPPTS